jgi:hypothetical protein
VRALIRRVALRVADEAGRAPASQKPYQRPSGTPGQARDASGWLGDAIAASPLWLLMPTGAITGTRALNRVEKP